MSEIENDDAGWPVVITEHGPVGGERAAGAVVFKSIPYAAPLEPSNRFLKPQPPEPWTAVKDCTKHRDIAPQMMGKLIPLDGELNPGPDCLWLNVWTPEIDDKRRPVMVWVHGGAYCLGTAAQGVYDGRHLAVTGDVVIVVLNFRIGALGFVDLSAFSTPDCEFVPNLGLHDILAGLRWVRDNIAAFGGDPDQVTIFGESAGGGCVTTLMVSPPAEGLFHRAIAQSSPASAVFGPERAELVARRFLAMLDVEPENARELCNLPLQTLAEAADTLAEEFPAANPGVLGVSPVVDGDIVPRYPIAAYQKGLSHRIPLIIGTNADEASLFKFIKSQIMPVTPEAVNTMLEGIAKEHPTFSPERIAEIVAAYPDMDRAKGAMAISRDAGFRMPTIWLAEAHSRHSPTFLYRFDYATPILKAARLGATHATELPYVFGNFGTVKFDPTFWLGGRQVADQIAGRIQRRWLAFARYGVPAALDASKHWAPYDERKRLTLLIDAVDTLVSDPDEELRKTWGDQVLAFS
ncbi:MAG: carboxylesterase/lipase family protein [Nocardiaceae bacterium]|nr:carboxylesterase/lipase family protein [Nocardiaceae bacterium]